jgi:hypothetical protein
MRTPVTIILSHVSDDRLPAIADTAAAAQVPAVDWKKQEAEILRHHRALVQIDTSPPSHETKVDDYLKGVPRGPSPRF